MKRTDKIVIEIKRWIKAHWQICAMGLFFLLTGIACGNRLYITLSPMQKAQCVSAVFAVETQGKFLDRLAARLLFCGVECLFSVYAMSVPCCLCMEMLHIALRTLCWRMIYVRQTIYGRLLCVGVMAGCLLGEYLRELFLFLSLRDYYKHQYRQLHIPKSAAEVRRESIGQMAKLFLLFVRLVPLWGAERMIWRELWE